jgi:hypothetical protein
MKIVSIFALRLFALHYSCEEDDEYNRLIEQWTSPKYLIDFANANGLINTPKFVEERIEDAEQIIDIIDEIENSGLKLETYFRALNDNEIGYTILSLQKGKTYHLKRKNNLRLYAIKIDDDCFIITGGAIKMSQKMQDHNDTLVELKKLNKAKDYFVANDVHDIDSFTELINE